MTRATIPILQCDGDDGFCTAESNDFYEMCADTVNSRRVTSTERGLDGWVSRGDEDYCPDHAHEAKGEQA